MIRSVVRAVDKLAENRPLSGLTKEEVVIVQDTRGIGFYLGAILKERGCQVRLVEHADLDCEVVIYLQGVNPVNSREEAIALNQNAFEEAHRLAKKFREKGGSFVFVQDTGGDFGLCGQDPMRAWTAGPSSLAKTAALEWPRAAIKVIDLECAAIEPKVLAHRLADELFTGGNAPEVGLCAEGKRIILENKNEDFSKESKFFLPAQSVVIVSGGGRGITAACTEAFAKYYNPRLVLLGRSILEDEPEIYRNAVLEKELKQLLVDLEKKNNSLPRPAEISKKVATILAQREIRNTIQKLKSMGIQVLYYAVDVQNKEALRKIVSEINVKWGEISGLIHAAGVLFDKLIEEKTIDQFSQVFNTKVNGLSALLDVLATQPLKLLCLFSSVVARFGNVGQSDYGMANEVLNKVAEVEKRRRGDKCLVKSINWGPWHGGMVTPELAKQFEKRGVDLLPIEIGQKLFISELELGNHVEVVLGNQLNLVPDHFKITIPPYDFILDHCINGTPILPLCVALEWFIQAIQRHFPGQFVGEITDLKVLQGIRLDNIKDEPKFYVNIFPGKDLNLSLRSEGNRLHYSASASLGARNLAPIHPEKLLLEGIKQEIYQDQLFHGTSLQVIQSIEMSDHGCKAVLKGVKKMSWLKQDWQTDIAAFDGGLQMAILWGYHTLGKPTLPTKIGKVVRYMEGCSEELIHCFLQPVKADSYRTVTNLLFSDREGRVLVEFHDVEMCIVTSGKNP